jgi:hypothetical protein
VGTVAVVLVVLVGLVGYRTAALKSEFGSAQLKLGRQCLLHPNLTVCRS